VGVLPLAILLVSCGPANPLSPNPNPNTPPREVLTATASRRPLSRVVSVLGSFLAKQEAELSAKVPGHLARLQVDLGSHVQIGDVIAEIESRDYELRLQQAEAALVQAKALLGLEATADVNALDLEQTAMVREARAVYHQAKADRDRVHQLQSEGILSSAEFDRVEADYQVAWNRLESALEEVRQRRAGAVQRQVEVEIARQQLTDATVRAPFEGLIQRRQANPGQYMKSGDPLVRLVQVDPLRLRLEVPEREALKIRPGQEVWFKVTGETQQRTAQVSRISPALDQTSRVLVIEADVANPGDLHPGSFAEARIAVARETAVLMVPSRALRTFAGLEKAFVVEDGRAAERDVTTGQREGEWVEITQGLADGDLVILDPGNLRNGAPVLTSPSS
jgi:RND family efflux transporter MFP subunit